MRCSIIIPVLDSHEIFRRQMLRFQQIVSTEFEVIILDDGSIPPLEFREPTPFPFQLVPTNDHRPWTSNLARNFAAQFARGDYFLMTDIDHILTSEALQAVLEFPGDMLMFARQVGNLDEQGQLCDLGETLHPHVNTFAIRKDIFRASGGYDEIYRGYGYDRIFRDRYLRLVRRKLAAARELGPTIYVITEQKWFHNLKREKAPGSPSEKTHHGSERTGRNPIV